MSTPSSENRHRSDLPHGVYALAAIQAKTDPLDRIKNLKTNIEYLLRELQTDTNKLREGKEPSLGERVSSWARSSDPLALRRAIDFRNDVEHATGRSGADEVAENELVLLRTLEEVLSDVETNPDAKPEHVEIARQIRGGVPVPRGEIISLDWRPDSRWNKITGDYEFGVTIRSHFRVSGMRGQEGCIAARFFDGHDRLPLPACAAEPSLQLGNSFVQERGSYESSHQSFFDFNQTLRTPLQRETAVRRLRYRVGLWRRPNPRGPWLQVLQTVESEMVVCIPGVRLSVTPTRDLTYKRQIGLFLKVTGVAAGLRGRRYVVGAEFYDDRGGKLENSRGPIITKTSLAKSFTAADDICQIEWSDFMPYDALPSSWTSPKFKCRVGVCIERGELPPCPVYRNLYLPLMEGPSWVVGVSELISFSI